MKAWRTYMQAQRQLLHSGSHSHSRTHRHATLLAAVLMWDHCLLVNRCSAEWKGERPEIICLIWSSSQLSRWEEGRKRACVRVFFLCAVVLSVCVWRQVRVSLHLPQLQTLNLLVWVMTCGKQNLLHPFHPPSCHFLPNPSSVPRPPPTNPTPNYLWIAILLNPNLW